MGEGLITRRGGDKPQLPVLNSSYPQDKSITFNSGSSGSATFNVNISEDGKPAEYTYKWYLDGTVVSEATSETYTWTGTTGGTHYIYCEVTNKAGTVTSRTATLTATMHYKPVLDSSYPANQTVEYGGSANFSISIATAGNPSTYTYQWYKDSTAISGATGSSYTASGWASGSYSIYCAVTNAAGTVNSRTATYVVGSASPTFTYNGNYSGGTADSSGNWQITFTSGGTLNFSNRGTGINGIDVFVVGGGAGGQQVRNIGFGGGGGGGGRTSTKTGISITKGTNYTITIGSGGSGNGAGGTTSAVFGGTTVSATGGATGANHSWQNGGGAGGSGGGSGSSWDGTRTPGNGGTNGGNGGAGNWNGGSGQGSTTRAFGGSSGNPYSGGGAGGRCGSMAGANSSATASGGSYGGGNPQSAATWYGGGGGGGNYQNSTWGSGGKGYQGIVIIRNKR